VGWPIATPRRDTAILASRQCVATAHMYSPFVFVNSVPPL
jgi:hypothetical protein